MKDGVLMKKTKKLANLAKIIRILTIPPIMAITLLTTLYIFKENVFTNFTQFIISVITIAIIPVLAYPLQSKLKIFKGEDVRNNQRNLAVIFSVAGYLIGTIYAMVSNVPSFQLILYVTYLFSGIGIFIGTFILKVKFSGHMCGISGPIISVSYIISWYFMFLYLLVGLVFWASLYSKKHTVVELLIGNIIPVASFLIAILII